MRLFEIYIKNWTTLIVMPFLLLQSACTEQVALSGKLILPDDNHWSNYVYLIQPNSLDELATSFTGTVIDSAIILADGRFAFEQLPNAEHPQLFELAVQRKGERFLNRLNNEDLASSNYFPVIWQNGSSILVTANIEHFQGSFSIENPSPQNAALLELRDIRAKAFNQYFLSGAAEGHDETKIIEEEAAQLAFQQALIDLALNTEHLLPALMAVRWVSPNNDYERIPEFLVDQCQKWRGQYAKHPWVVQLCSKANPENLPVLLGDKIPNAALPMLSDDTLNLNQLIAPKLTLVDLWASWCAPCRRENKEVLVPLWEQFHQNGFEIIGYSLDASKKAWKKAIDKDGAYRWLHASHLQGDDAPLLDVLRIRTIPANYLLNAEGEIIAKNLHGDALIAFIETYMAK